MSSQQHQTITLPQSETPAEPTGAEPTMPIADAADAEKSERKKDLYNDETAILTDEQLDKAAENAERKKAVYNDETEILTDEQLDKAAENAERKKAVYNDETEILTDEQLDKAAKNAERKKAVYNDETEILTDEQLDKAAENAERKKAVYNDETAILTDEQLDKAAENAERKKAVYNDETEILTDEQLDKAAKNAESKKAVYNDETEILTDEQLDKAAENAEQILTDEQIEPKCESLDDDPPGIHEMQTLILDPVSGKGKEIDQETSYKSHESGSLLKDYADIVRLISKDQNGSMAVSIKQPEAGDTIEHYLLESKVGEGGFGSVYRARNLKIGREVAIKCILPEVSGRIPDTDQRFIREINVISRLEHPNIIRLYNANILPNGTLWMATEFVHGIRLDDMIQNNIITFSDAKSITCQILFGLKEAHSQGLLHRDIKPSNIMITRKEGYSSLVKILDFGLAKAFGDHDDDNIKNLTKKSSKIILGTPNYMPPEQLNHQSVGPWTDIYAVGLIFIEMITGNTVVTGKTPVEIAVWQLSKEAIELPKSWKGTAIEQVIKKATAKDPDKRYQNASDFLDALFHINSLNDPPSVLDAPLSEYQLSYHLDSEKYHTNPTVITQAIPQKASPKPNFWKRAFFILLIIFIICMISIHLNIEHIYNYISK